MAHPVGRVSVGIRQIPYHETTRKSFPTAIPPLGNNRHNSYNPSMFPQTNKLRKKKRRLLTRVERTRARFSAPAREAEALKEAFSLPAYPCAHIRGRGRPLRVDDIGLAFAMLQQSIVPRDT